MFLSVFISTLKIRLMPKSFCAICQSLDYVAKRIKIKGLKLESGLFKYSSRWVKETKPYTMQEPFLEGHDLPAFPMTSCLVNGQDEHEQYTLGWRELPVFLREDKPHFSLTSCRNSHHQQAFRSPTLFWPY